MPRWYAVFKTYGDPKKMLETIAHCIRRDDLSRIVPRLIVENREKKSKGPFYFALAIESDQRGQPPAALDHLLTISMFQSPTRGTGTRFAPFEREQLRSMMGSEQTVEDIARVLRYARSGELAPDDPFANPHDAGAGNDMMGTGNSETDGGDVLLDRIQGYDRLLTWVSAMGSGSLAQLRAACVALGLSAPQDGSARILRRLRVLGHLETSLDGRRWSVAPPALVQCGDDREQLFLAGARDASLLATLRNYGDVEETPMGGGDAPSHVAVRLGDPRMVEWIDALRPLGAGPAGERIAAVLPDIDGWADTLQCISGVHPELYDLRWYDGSAWVDVPAPKHDGLYAFHERTSDGFALGDPKFTLYRDRAGERWLRGDWYGLRFLAETRRRAAVPVRYDSATRRLAVLNDLRWPELYERTVVLASGRLPARNGPWLVYGGVSPVLLDLLTERLHLKIDGESPDA